MNRPYGTLSTLRSARKQETRERLLRAGAVVFASHGFTAGRIEDVVAEAAVSRQTFYIHFDSKEQLLLEIMHREEARMMAQYEALARLGPAAPDEAAGWAEEFLALAREDRATILLLMSTVPFEVAGAGTTSAFYRAVIAMLGRTLPAFAATMADQVREAAALLLFFQLEMMQRHALVEPATDCTALCRAWGEQWARYVSAT